MVPEETSAPKKNSIEPAPEAGIDRCRFRGRRRVAGRCMLWYEGSSNFIMRSPPPTAEGKLLLGLQDYWEQSVIYGRKLSDSMAASRLVTKTIMDGKTTFLIGVAGGTASGKSTVCQKIMEQLGQADMTDSQRKVACIAQDSFYKQLNGAESLKAAKGQYDFDHPNALDIDLMVETLKNVLSGKKTEVPVYDYVANARVEGESMTIYPADVVLFEGILAFYFPQVRDLFDMKLFVDTDPDTRLSRRVLRDVQDRGRDLDTVLSQYMRFVKPAFEEFCLPTKKFADVIIPRGADNIVAISLIVQHIQDLLSPTKKAAEVVSSDNDSMDSPVKEKPNPVAAKEGSQPTLPQKRRMTNELTRPH